MFKLYGLTVSINILESFMTILYDFEKHNSLIALLERLLLLPQKFICLGV